MHAAAREILLLAVHVKQKTSTASSFASQRRSRTNTTIEPRVLPPTPRDVHAPSTRRTGAAPAPHNSGCAAHPLERVSSLSSPRLCLLRPRGRCALLPHRNRRDAIILPHRLHPPRRLARLFQNPNTQTIRRNTQRIRKTKPRTIHTQNHTQPGTLHRFDDRAGGAVGGAGAAGEVAGVVE
ncbi:hypothetical protein B0H16DRAFT_1513728, partial [Mycena metata]